MSEPLFSVVGGVLIGIAASSLMFFNGKIAGVSGIYSGLLSPKAGDFLWRILFVAGMVAGGAVLGWVKPELYHVGVDRSLGALVVGGLLVGFGTRMGNGCTSGHGVCGVARLSPRSLVATVVFIGVGMAVTYVVNHLLGGSL